MDVGISTRKKKLALYSATPLIYGFVIFFSEKNNSISQNRSLNVEKLKKKKIFKKYQSKLAVD